MGFYTGNFTLLGSKYMPGNFVHVKNVLFPQSNTLHVTSLYYKVTSDFQYCDTQRCWEQTAP
jgi:hypothetical protein